MISSTVAGVSHVLEHFQVILYHFAFLVSQVEEAIYNFINFGFQLLNVGLFDGRSVLFQLREKRLYAFVAPWYR